MTVDLVSNEKPTARVANQASASWWDGVTAALAPLASLKLTVSLLIIAVIVTFIGTLEQTRADINTVKSRYFLENRILVEVPLNVFMVPAWFPTMQNIRGSIWVPSGMTILMLMILNMTAAHMIRFRLQARGMRLVWGLFFAAVSTAFTWVIIFNTQSPGAAPGEPPISWMQMWIALQIVILGVACAAAFGCFTISADKKYERLFMGLTAGLAGGALLLTVLLPNKGFIGDSAMRIVWQLAQSTAAASISLVACMLLFRRKGGIVLLHLGVLGLMANELYVNYTNNEQRITLYEGETSSQAVDIRSVELAVVDTSHPENDLITVVPLSQLRSKSRIESEHLPFDLSVIEFFENSDIDLVKDKQSNRATKGAGLVVEVQEKPVTSGIDMRGRNFSSAYLEIFEKGTANSLGVYLVSQFFDIPELNRVFKIAGKDQVEVNGVPYTLDLRFKTEYKPYSVTLTDVTAEYYLATRTPKYFSSDIVFNDRDKGITFDHRIWMNNPMRYAGETFYQTNYDKDKSGREISTLQIVTNRGWMIPYVCCMFTVVGLLVQFGGSLLGFLEKRSRTSDPSASSKPLPAGAIAAPNLTSKQELPQLVNPIRSAEKWNWLVPAVLTGILGVYLAGEGIKSYSSKVTKGDFRLDLLGQIPVTKNGRVQPLDSVARHAVLQMSKREYVNNKDELKQPAIRWLADTMFGVEGYDEYRLFRIEDSEILTALNLPFPMPTQARHEKSNLKYTLQEVLKGRPKIREILTGDPEKWTASQQNFAKVASLANQAISLELTLGDARSEQLGFFQRLELAELNAGNEAIPLAVPTENPEKPWISFVELENRLWLGDLCRKYTVATTTELASALIAQEFLPFQREEVIKSRVIDKIVNSEELSAALNNDGGKLSKQEMRKLLESRWDQVPAEAKEAMIQAESPLVDALMQEQLPRLERVMESQLSKINGGSGKIATELKSTIANLANLRPAYQDGDADTFNQILVDYLASIKTNPPKEMSLVGVATENWYNRFAPFYWATVIYAIVMIVGVLSWVVFTEPLNRTAGWLLWLGVVIHLIGLIARVVISGRPPVTNLYSSFLFVADVFVIGMLLLERMTKMKVGYFLAGLGGFLGLLAAWNLTITDGDTFSVLVAVLDTQFWLATHVVTISIGYGATMIAGFLGMAFILRGLFTKSLDKEARRTMGSVIYGTTCFGLITSFFGTVLGGLWGDDSWGRFWGWDPKENGALMIVLWNAVILHARWGGMVKERGMAVLAIFGNIITLWSWKGVNALGVGLHAYAGTEDKALIYMILFGVIGVLIAAAGLIPTAAWRSYATAPR